MLTSSPMPRLVLVNAVSRSSNTFGMEIVVELKISPPQEVATSSTRMMRIIVRVSMCSAPFLPVFTIAPGSATYSSQPMPAAMQMAPGTKNAVRQP